jgi:hypothetical protein
VISHDVVSRTFQLAEDPDVVLQCFELPIVHFPRGLALGDLATEVTQIDSEVRLELLHLVDELLEVGFVAGSPASQQMRIGVQAEPERRSICGRID